MVASDTKRRPSLTALLTARSGTESGRRRWLTMALVSSTTRSTGGMASLVVGEDLSELFFSHPARLRAPADDIAQPFQLDHVRGTQPVVFLQRQHDGHVSLLPANRHGLALGRVEDFGETLLGVGGGYVAHADLQLSILDKLDKLDRKSTRLNSIQ